MSFFLVDLVDIHPWSRVISEKSFPKPASGNSYRFGVPRIGWLAVSVQREHLNEWDPSGDVNEKKMKALLRKTHESESGVERK